MLVSDVGKQMSFIISTSTHLLKANPLPQLTAYHLFETIEVSTEKKERNTFAKKISQIHFLNQPNRRTEKFGNNALTALMQFSVFLFG